MSAPETVFDTIFGRLDWADRPAILGDRACTYGELLARTEKLAGAITKCGAHGAAIGVAIPPSLDYVTALLAVYLAGGVLVPMNPNAAANEKGHVLADCGAKLFITTEDAARTGEFLSPQRETAWNDLRLLTLAPGDTGAAPQSDDYCIVYTSGSTSRPKGVVLGRNAISANVRAIAGDLRLTPDDKSIVFTPPAYTYALSQTLTHLGVGGAVLPWPHGLMYPAQILKAIAAERLTGLAANPTSMRMFLSLKQTAGLDLNSVRYVKSAGQPLYSNIARGMAALFPKARIVCTYGCTENSPRIAHYWLPPDVPDRDGPWPAGKPLAGTEVRIADAQGRQVAADGTGNIEVRGSSLMRCYWNAPEITRKRLRDGWFLTGDLGFFDSEGRLNVVGRADNIIGVGHEKVSPEEVEAVISKIDGVGEVAVGGVPDPLLDQVPVALLVLDGEKSPTPDEIRNICRKKLSSPKVPGRFFVIETIPKTLYGKPDRKAIGETIRRLMAKRDD